MAIPENLFFGIFYFKTSRKDRKNPQDAAKTLRPFEFNPCGLA